MSGEGDTAFPGFMLFGRKIPVPECQIPVSSQMGCQIQANSTTMNSCITNSKKTGVEMPHTENSEKSKTYSDLRDTKQESLQNVKENESKVNTKPIEDNMETSSTDQDKALKKPDKILHCPRCNSLETKFCYFNNYNVNQPRHFCKNCQRYWTAGGAMRSVPVGSGRRKNKHVDHQYQHMIIASNGIPTNDSSTHQQVSSLESAAIFGSSTDNGTILKFGHDAPLNESMDSILNLINHKRTFDAISMNCKENQEEEVSLCGSSVTNACTQGAELSENNRSKPFQCYPFPQLLFPLNPNWNNVASMVQSSMQWCPAPMAAVQTVFPPSIPLQFVHGSYWHGTPLWSGGNGTVSIGSNGCVSPSSSTSNSCCSGNGSPPTLGKYNRDFVPKTLRIDDPNEA